MKTSRFLSLSCAVLLTVVLAGCSGRSPGEFQGYIEGEYVYVASPLGGALARLAVARGDSVKPGQLLFELERQSEAAALDQAQKNLAQAKAGEDMARSTYQRRKELRETPSAVVSAEELDKARTDHDTAVAQVAAQSAALDKAQWSFDQKQQSAPTNAFVQDTLYRQGEWVAAGNPVITLLPPENLKVRFFVPQEMLPKIKTGATVNVTFDGGTKTYSATVNYISAQAEFTPPVIYNRENRSKLVYMIEAKFSAADAPDLRPGQPVDVKLP
ncbi:MAG: efflux RND transporter periplasmic adaptor subunit [Verrucomicrobia bacterium]|nr:efflux RND transporter periplasmic adaptor subunit [Verrucomicrobiota bacterium]